ncbi:hypothetical protein YB2330_002374 [Saitoella coloradoensis]
MPSLLSAAKALCFCFTRSSDSFLQDRDRDREDNVEKIVDETTPLQTDLPTSSGPVGHGFVGGAPGVVGQASVGSIARGRTVDRTQGQRYKSDTSNPRWSPAPAICTPSSTAAAADATSTAKSRQRPANNRTTSSRTLALKARFSGFAMALSSPPLSPSTTGTASSSEDGDSGEEDDIPLKYGNTWKGVNRMRASTPTMKLPALLPTMKGQRPVMNVRDTSAESVPVSCMRTKSKKAADKKKGSVRKSVKFAKYETLVGVGYTKP